MTAGKQYGYLLHNNNRRYEADEEIPLLPESFVFSEKNFKLPARCRLSGAVDLFQGDQERPTRHALSWIRGKRGIPCSKTGGFLGEYNLRFPHNPEENFPELFLQCIKDQYKE